MSDYDLSLRKPEAVKLPDDTRRLLGRFNRRLIEVEPQAPAAASSSLPARQPDFDPADPYGIEERKARRAKR